VLATLAGAGLRIDEALSLQRRHVNIAKGPGARVGAMGTNDAITVSPAPPLAVPENEETRHLQRAS
jgi:hypothetical protein